MRPPEFTGGNPYMAMPAHTFGQRWYGFNEAAGIHRRKPITRHRRGVLDGVPYASMRPPEFTGGNGWNDTNGQRCPCGNGRFNEAAGIHRRKRYDQMLGSVDASDF